MNESHFVVLFFGHSRCYVRIAELRHICSAFETELFNRVHRICRPQSVKNHPVRNTSAIFRYWKNIEQYRSNRGFFVIVGDKLFERVDCPVILEIERDSGESMVILSGENDMPLPLSQYEDYMKKTSVMTELRKVVTKKTGDETSLLNDNMLFAAYEVSEGLPGGFFSYHADGNLELISINEELVSMFDCKTGDEFRSFVGNSFRGIVLPEDFDRIQNSINGQITVNNDIDQVDYRIRTKSGTIKYVRDYGRFVKTKKFGDIFFVFIYDITEEENRKSAEAEEQRKKLELQRTADIASAANKAKSIFMFNIAEEVIQPIKHIVNCTSTMMDNLTKPDIVKENIMKSRKHEEYLLQYVNNMLEYARLEQGEIKVIERAIDTTEAVKNIYGLIENKVKEKGIEVEYWSDIKHPYIFQDIKHTTTVVMNIMLNAVKYTPPGGKIKFGLKQTPGDNPNYCLIHFICEDTGIGISEEFLPFVYKSFARYLDIN